MDNNEEFTRHRCAAAPGHECLSDPSSLNNPNQYDDNGDDQQNVDKSAHGVRRNQSQRPQDNKYDCNGAEHDDDLLCCCFLTDRTLFLTVQADGQSARSRLVDSVRQRTESPVTEENTVVEAHTKNRAGDIAVVFSAANTREKRS